MNIEQLNKLLGTDECNDFVDTIINEVMSIPGVQEAVMVQVVKDWGQHELRYLSNEIEGQLGDLAYQYVWATVTGREV